MKAGNIATVSRTFDEDTTISGGQQEVDGEYSWVVTQDQHEQIGVNVGTDHEKFYPLLGGRAAWKERSEEETLTITGGGDVRREPEVVETVHVGRWAIVPGEVAVVEKDPICWYLSAALPGVDVEASELDLREFADEHPDARQWQTGFAGRPVGEGANKGALYGNQIEEDPDLGGDLARTPLNELGVEYLYGTDQCKAYLAASGYVAAYVDGWDSHEFLPWVIEEVAPYMEAQ